MKILVVGATGLLGTDLCQALQDQHEVIGWARKVPAPKDSRVRFVSQDLLDSQAVRAQLETLSPELVIHAAAMSDVDACERDSKLAFQMNAQVPQTVAQGCSQVGAKLIAVSTDYVFDGVAGRSYREEDPTGPICTYARSKHEGEQGVLSKAPDALVVRVSGLFGGSRANFVTSVVEKFRSGQKASVVTDQINSPSYTVDLAEGFRRLVEHCKEIFAETPPGAGDRIFHLANAGGASRLEVAQCVAGCLGVSEDLIEKTTWVALDRPAQRPKDTRLDCSRFEEKVGVALRPWTEAIEAFLDSMHLDPIAPEHG